MRRFKKWLSLVLVICCMVCLAACGASKEETTVEEGAVVEESTPSDEETEVVKEDAADDITATDSAVQNVIDRGKLIVGVKYDVPKFGYDNPETGELEGMEIDLARKLAGKILGDENAVEFVMVTAKTRGPLMDSGEIDVTIATMTTNEERLASYAHTEPYYTDIGAVMVLKDSGITSFEELDGKTIGAPQGSTSINDAIDKAAEYGITIESAEFPTIADCKAALVAGRVDGITNDTCMLNGLMDDNTMLLPEKYHKQQYRIWAKLGNDSMIEVAQKMLDSMTESGELQALFDSWGLEDNADYEE